MTGHWVLVPAEDGGARLAPLGPDGLPAGPVRQEPDLVAAVRQGERPNGRTQAWIAAEAGVVRELRRFVVGELGVARDVLHAAAYWKSGLDSTEGDAVLLERYREEVAAGADVSDPDVRERVELELSAVQ